MPLPLDYEFCARTDVGRVRSNNEDSVAVSRDARMVIVADGMGGYNAGEVASVMVVQILNRELRNRLVAAGASADVALVRDMLTKSVDRANSAVYQAAKAHAHYAGMGTTLIVGLFGDHRVVIGHIGDSRAYLLRGGAFSRLTRDHTWLQEQVDKGEMTPLEAQRSGMRSLLTRAVGVDPQVRLEVNEFPVERGDLFLFCSDGLTDSIDDAELAVLLRDPSPLPTLTERLVQQANALGGRDNISALLVRAGATAPVDAGYPR
ncbi:MAG: Stp1/IreP family PP2C-type Ser/Thr phosphatase [Comamonas sp.]|nr:Stp1/IreP family PP2C-type Ser/Thr phosphatase [Comamonas sp.]